MVEPCLSPSPLSLLLFLLCVCGESHNGDQRITMGVGRIFLLCEFQELNSGVRPGALSSQAICKLHTAVFTVKVLRSLSCRFLVKHFYYKRTHLKCIYIKYILKCMCTFKKYMYILIYCHSLKVFLISHMF